MGQTQDIVFAAIKNGCCSRKQILEDTGLSLAQVHNSLKRLRKWGLVGSNMHGTYFVAEEPKVKRDNFLFLGKDENNF